MESFWGDVFVFSEAKQYIQRLHGFIYYLLVCCACVVWFFSGIDKFYKRLL